MSNVNVNAPSSTQQATNEKATNKLSSDFNTFLKLLTAQVRNQDPLTPLDSTKFVEQLATFSGLEQQISTNTKLDAITQLVQKSLGDQSTKLLGRDVTASSVSVTNGAFPAQSITTSGKGEGVLIVRNSKGAIVYKGESGTSWQWNGRTTAGGEVPSDTYSFEIKTKNSTHPAVMSGKVDRVVKTENGDTAIGFAPGVTTTKYQLSKTQTS